jgi:hypothetical protein
MRESKYLEQQQELWRSLSQVLRGFREFYGATIAELCEGLQVSRQKLYDFLNNPLDGLPITWSSLMNLWELLSDPGLEIEGKLKREELFLRRQLKKEGPEPLLRSAGFTSASSQGEAMSSQDISPLTGRIINRFTSSWIKNEYIRESLAKDFLRMMTERGNATQEDDSISKKENLFLWPEQQGIYNQHNTLVKVKYKNAVSQIYSTGKHEFTPAELYELSQSILEHHTFNDQIPNHIQVIDCQFRILSSSLYAHNSMIKADFTKAEKLLENFVSENAHTYSNEVTSPDNNSEQEISELQPVIEVAIKCNIAKNNSTPKFVVWRYASTGPHISVMLDAVRNGIGYSFTLNALQTNKIGTLDSGLLRSEVTIMDRKRPGNTYHGWWVDADLIMSILHACIDSLKRWLAALNPHIGMHKYYASFASLAEADELLFLSRAAFYSKDAVLSFRVAKDCIKRIDDMVQQAALEENDSDPLLQSHELLLRRKSDTARLTSFHMAILEGDITKAREFLINVEEIVYTKPHLKNNEDGIVYVNATSCLMLYKLTTGDKAFLSEREWRKSPVLSFEANLEAIRAYSKPKGCLDGDSFLYASQYFGIMGLMELYSACNGEENELDKAIFLFKGAAHFAFRIGHSKRGFHWLAHVVRVLVRLKRVNEAVIFEGSLVKATNLNTILGELGDVEPLMTYHNFSEKLQFFQDHENRALNKGSAWSLAAYLIARAEIALSKNDYSQAAFFCAESIVGSLKSGFARLLLDGLLLSASLPENSFHQCIFILKEHLHSKNLWERNWITVELQKLLSNHAILEHSDLLTKTSLRSFILKVWNTWCINDKSHPFSQLIEKESFLKPLCSTENIPGNNSL